jgi:molybdate transport system ATP-binding protein
MDSFKVDIRVTRTNGDRTPFLLDARFATDKGSTVLFGPSGAGKSTLLQAILGGQRPDSGSIEVCGTTVFDSDKRLNLRTRERGVGVVFQDALLFPHLSARRNVAFGIRGRNRYSRAQELLDLVGGSHLGHRLPAELSGGELQRIALARALAARPVAILLDEPFSALDARSRESLGNALREIQKETGIPFLHVTHDITEALRLGDHMVVLDHGQVVQEGLPTDVVASPTSEAAATAVGTENLFRAEVLRHHSEDGYTTMDLGGTEVETCLIQAPVGRKVAIGLRAEDVLLSLAAVQGTSARNILKGTVTAVTPKGAAMDIRIETPAPIHALVTQASVRELDLRPGKSIYLLIKAASFHRLV